jgi:hypothetical protein
VSVLGLGIIAWLAGLFAYIGALALVYGQWIGGDFQFVGFVSLVAFALCYWLLYLPVLRIARRLLPRHPPAWVFALIAILLGIVPTALIARFYGGSLRALVTPEAILFYVLFAVVGLVVGVGFTHLRPDKRIHVPD